MVQHQLTHIIWLWTAEVYVTLTWCQTAFTPKESWFTLSEMLRLNLQVLTWTRRSWSQLQHTYLYTLYTTCQQFSHLSLLKRIPQVQYQLNWQQMCCLHIQKLNILDAFLFFLFLKRQNMRLRWDIGLVSSVYQLFLCFGHCLVMVTNFRQNMFIYNQGMHISVSAWFS